MEPHPTANNVPSHQEDIVILSARLLSNSPPSPQQAAYGPTVPGSSSIALHKSLEACRTSPNAFPNQRPPYHPSVQHRLDHTPQYASNVKWHQPGSNRLHALQPAQRYASPIGPSEPQSIPAPTSCSTPSCYDPQIEVSPTNTSTPYHASQVPPLNYSIIVRQQPAAARACGFNQRDRRVIDPPPILELKITDKATCSPQSDSNSMLAMYCTLLDPSNPEDETKTQPIGANMQSTSRLTGTLVASPYQAEDERGVAGIFFVFPDLSCSAPGRYRLYFKLLRIDMYNMQQGAIHGIVASIITDVFSVYTAKEFPGMRASSALLTALRRQGLNIGVKKGSVARRGKKKTKDANSSDEDGSDASADERGLGGRAGRRAQNG